MDDSDPEGGTDAPTRPACGGDEDFSDTPDLGELRAHLAEHFYAVQAREQARQRRAPRTLAGLRLRTAAVIAFLLATAGTAVAAIVSYQRSAPLSGRLPPASSAPAPGFGFQEAGRHYRIVVSPVLIAGRAGWTSFIGFGQGVQGGGGSGYPTARHPIWLGEGTGFSETEPTSGQVVEYVLTGPKVAAVRIGSTVIQTRTSSALASGDRVAVFLLPAHHRPLSVREAMRPSHASVKSLYVTPLAGNGQPISPGKERSTRSPAMHEWHRLDDGPVPAESRTGACLLQLHGSSALQLESGQVVDAIQRVSDAAGELLLSCVQSTYRLGRWTLTAAILLNARHPGSPPGSIPSARPVRGHADIVNAAYGSPPGDITARRSDDAWLVVQGGRNLAQRLRVLNELRIARISLPR